MKRLALCVALALAMPCVMAQAPAAAKGGAAGAWPQPMSSPKEAHSMRLDILNKEREGIDLKLSEAVTALPKATDMQASLKDISRLQADLQAIDREIANVEGQRRKNGNAAAARKSAGRTAGDVSPPPEQLAEAEQANVEYEAWDVFKNFGKKVNK